jgi:hypothetical protein
MHSPHITQQEKSAGAMYMDFKEDDKEIVLPIMIRGNKSKPGAGFIYLGSDLFSKMELEIDTPMVLRFDKETREICIKPLQY